MEGGACNEAEASAVACMRGGYGWGCWGRAGGGLGGPGASEAAKRRVACPPHDALKGRIEIQTDEVERDGSRAVEATSSSPAVP